MAEEKLQWSDLTEEERVRVSNGCGGKGGWFNPPEFLFHASCDQHDFYYWRGHTKADRKTADREFHLAMKVDVSKAAWYRRWYLYGFAWTYYRAVRFSGSKFFHFGDVYRGRDELGQVVGEGGHDH